MDYDWRSELDAAIKRNRREAHNRYLQLATVREDGSPANRTLVFRGFESDSNRLLMVTDARSEKPGQVAADARAEICWYFTASREQFRLRGSLAVISCDAPDSEQRVRSAMWAGLSEPARAQFFWPAPGQPVETASAPESMSAPPRHFLLLQFEPGHVDHLRLAGNPQRRILSERIGADWQSRAVNP